ncbi:outer membrane beta-barrel protein [Xanthovirga aplysinae]|uniref:outer membrane beta-barrel protein n=1 Tax=Xanthovirga aplysinae TaxID=2529853 RepID=UPI0016569498|nr:outer membrane beta-barrel protein [Xanthovirga aplysinae]
MNETLTKKILLVFIFLLSTDSYAQVNLRGIVRDEKEGITYANVALLDSMGNTVAGTYSDEQGQFSMHSKAGNYTLAVSFIGYESWVREIALKGDQDLGEIVLVNQDFKLDEVAIVGNKQLIESSLDRLTFHVENSVAANGGDALDALRLAPGLRLTDNEIAIVGKGEVRVMIDGRILQLTGKELISYLGSISANDIKKIEVITNPPARFDAEGNSGIINIILKNGIKDSWSNTVSSTYTAAVHSFYDFRNTFSYQKNRIKALFNFNGRKGSREVLETADIFYPEESWRSAVSREDRQDYFSGRIAFDYELGENLSIGFQYLENTSNPDIQDQTNTVIFNPWDIPNYSLLTNAVYDFDNHSRMANVHVVSHLDTLGRKLSVDLDYFKYSSALERTLETERFSPKQVSQGIDFSAVSSADQVIKNYSARIDVEHPTTWANISYGIKASLISNGSITDFYNKSSGEAVLDPELTDNFQYDENIQALYLSAGKNLGEKWEAKAGLRLENTLIEGKSRHLGEKIERKYFNLFPTFYLNYLLDDKNVFSMNYGKRINRPSYWYLNPFRTFLNGNFSTEGNPFLQPSLNDNFEFSHVYKNQLTTSLSLHITSNGFGTLAEIDVIQNIVRLKKENFFTEYNFALTESYLFNQWSWLESNITLVAYYKSLKFEDVGFAIDQLNEFFSYYFILNNAFSLNSKKTLKAQLNYWYASPFLHENKKVYSRSSLDLTLRFDMPKQNLQFSLGFFDILKTSSWDNGYTINDIRQEFTNYWGNRNIRFSLNYKFGNKQVKVGSRKFGNEEERRRAGN